MRRGRPRSSHRGLWIASIVQQSRIAVLRLVWSKEVRLLRRTDHLECVAVAVVDVEGMRTVHETKTGLFDLGRLWVHVPSVQVSWPWKKMQRVP